MTLHLIKPTAPSLSTSPLEWPSSIFLPLPPLWSDYWFLSLPPLGETLFPFGTETRHQSILCLCVSCIIKLPHWSSTDAWGDSHCVPCHRSTIKVRPTLPGLSFLPGLFPCVIVIMWIKLIIFNPTGLCHLFHYTWRPMTQTLDPIKNKATVETGVVQRC